MITYLIIFIATVIGLIAGFFIGMRKDKPIGTLTLNQGITDRPPFELRIYEDPKAIKSGELVTFELIVKE